MRYAKLNRMADPRILSASPQDGDAQFEAGLRPRRLKDFTGQTKLKENLAIGIEAKASGFSGCAWRSSR